MEINQNWSRQKYLNDNNFEPDIGCVNLIY